MKRLPKKKKSALPKPTCGCVYPGCICAHDASGCQTCVHDEAEGLLIACCICVARGHHKLPAGFVPPPEVPSPDPDDESFLDMVALMHECLQQASFKLHDLSDISTSTDKKRDDWTSSEAVAIAGAALFNQAVMFTCFDCGGNTFRPGHKCPPRAEKKGG